MILRFKKNWYRHSICKFSTHTKNALQFLFKIFQKSIGFQNYQAEIKYVYDQKFTCTTISSCHTSFYLSLAVDLFKLCAFEINCTKIIVKR